MIARETLSAVAPKKAIREGLSARRSFAFFVFQTSMHSIFFSERRPRPPLQTNLFSRSCAHELNALFTANAALFPSIAVKSRTTFTRAETAAVAARIASPACSSPSPSPWCRLTTAAPDESQTGQRPLVDQRANQHLALAAHVLSSAVFAPYYPTAAVSLYEIEAPAWLAGWAAKWCSSSAVAAVAPATPRNSPAASSNSLSSYSSDENSDESNAKTVVKLMALHGYAEGQPACGQGAGLGEEPTGGGKPARTVFLPVW